MATPPRDLTERSLRFSRELLQFIEGEQSRRAFPPRVLDQLLRAGISIGAQNAEADSAISRKHLLSLRARALQEATDSLLAFSPRYSLRSHRLEPVGRGHEVAP
jgi:hypothetical protein